MIESGYYPTGAEHDPRAPWNEPNPPEELSFEVCVSQTLSKNTKVITNDYFVEVDCDIEGYSTSIDTSETNWKEVYNKSKMTPLELIVELKAILERTLPDPVVFPKEYKKAKYLIEECENWIEDDFEIIEN
jgi:hypothetical protein